VPPRTTAVSVEPKSEDKRTRSCQQRAVQVGKTGEGTVSSKRLQHWWQQQLVTLPSYPLGTRLATGELVRVSANYHTLATTCRVWWREKEKSDARLRFSPSLRFRVFFLFFLAGGLLASQPTYLAQQCPSNCFGKTLHLGLVVAL